MSSRPKRWNQACAAAREAVENVNSSLELLRGTMEELKSIQEEYQEWRDSLPDNLTNSPVAEKLDNILNIDFEPDDLESMEAALGEAEGADLPMGFGRD